MTSTQCILSTGNIITSASEVLRTPAISSSSTELIASLRSHIRSSPPSPPPSPSLPPSAAAPLYIPLPPPAPESLSEDRAEYDITVKLFLSGSVTPAQILDAVKRVLRTLATDRIDLLILSLPGISFDAEDSFSPAADVDAWAATWAVLESLPSIARLGISEFGTARLSQLLPRTRVKPSVDQINVRDCCVVPKELILYAKEEGIELLTHNDCTDILPKGKLREVLVDEFALISDGKQVEPVWVAKYTAVIRSRGVVENKGWASPL